jgi:hypothetical protein
MAFVCLLIFYPSLSLALQFLIAVANYTGAGKEDKLKFAFMSFDEDGNGVITKAELLKILKSNHMASHDAEVARKADTIMAQADKDGDGVITFDEFVIVSKKFPNILVRALCCGVRRGVLCVTPVLMPTESGTLLQVLDLLP